MVLVRLLDENGKAATNGDGNITHIPDNISKMELGLYLFEYDDDDQRAYDDGFQSVDCNGLTKMLRCRSKKLSKITLNEKPRRESDYLALLIAVTQATDRLVICYQVEDEDEYSACDVGLSCLMSGILHQEGPRALHLNLSQTIYQWQLLCEGISQSTCLEVLELQNLFFEDEDLEMATDAFVDALQQNRSLKVLGIGAISLSDFEGIFAAAILNSKVQSLTLSNENGSDCFLGWGSVMEVLSSQDCRLESLEILSFERLFDDWVEDPSKTNTSVKEVKLLGVRLASSHLTQICSQFKSLTELHLDVNIIQDLSPLDTLLIGDDLKLQRLSLRDCKIDKNSIIDFFQKLPQMTHVQHLGLNGNPFLKSNEWIDVLRNAIRRNTSLESLYFGYWMLSRPDLKSFYLELEVALSFNRAWKRYMEKDTATNETKTLPSKLWPLVLDRATKISYFSCSDHQSPTLTSLKPDAVFWLLRERMVADAIFEP